MSILLGILLFSIFSGVITKSIEPNTLPEMLPSPEQLSAGIGNNCESNDDCLSITGATCHEGACECTLPLKNQNDSCVLGGVCTNHMQCTRNDTISDIICYPRPEDCKSYNETIEQECNNQEKNCKCRNGYEFDGSHCIKLFTTCKPRTPDCVGKGMCVLDICKCVPPFQLVNGKCEFGSNCTNNDNCTGIIPGLICNEHKCSCPKSLEFDGHECIESPNAVLPDSIKEVMDGSGSTRCSHGIILFITTTIFFVSSIIL